MPKRFRTILSSDRKSARTEVIGITRTGLPIYAGRYGTGKKRISLVAGMHADEPAGPLLLRYLTGFLSALPDANPLLRNFNWWIVPHANPDGEETNSLWFHHTHHLPEPGMYLAHVQREKPGDDLEFGFPYDDNDSAARPEAKAILNWWKADSTPFTLHLSLHGMGFAGGTWFLLQPDSTWDQEHIQTACRLQSTRMGYVLHDVERNGEKGFHRIAPGFCTHPTSKAMQEYFNGIGQPETAKLMRPTSMETIRSLGGDPLTLVSEIPLFILPGVGLEIGPPDPVAVQWADQIALWREELAEGLSPELINRRAEASGVMPVPFDHQMELQWHFILSALQTVAGNEADDVETLQ